MSREILFKGKRVDNNQWTEGFLSFIYTDGRNSNGFIYTDKAQIYSPVEVRSHDVYTSTVGQYTGYTDIKNHKIYEGDEVIDIAYPEEKYVVEYFQLGFDLNAYPEYRSFYELLERNRIEVIGNIHDTPDLAKEEAE